MRVSRKSLEKIYISYIPHPMLEYSDSVVENCSSDSNEQLETIHTEAARIILRTGATKHCSIEGFFTDMGWETLQSRGNKHNLSKFLISFFDGDIPRSSSYGVYISQLIRFARVCSNVGDFNNRNLFLTAKLLKQGYRYYTIPKAFSEFYHTDTQS